MGTLQRLRNMAELTDLHSAQACRCMRGVVWYVWRGGGKTRHNEATRRRCQPRGCACEGMRGGGCGHIGHGAAETETLAAELSAGRETGSGDGGEKSDRMSHGGPHSGLGAGRRQWAAVTGTASGATLARSQTDLMVADVLQDQL